MNARKTEAVVDRLRELSRLTDPAITLSRLAQDLGLAASHATLSELGSLVRAAGWACRQETQPDGSRPSVYRPCRRRPEPSPDQENAPPAKLGIGWLQTFAGDPEHVRAEGSRNRTYQVGQSAKLKKRLGEMERQILEILRASSGPVPSAHVCAKLHYRKESILGRLHSLRERGRVDGPPWRATTEPAP